MPEPGETLEQFFESSYPITTASVHTRGLATKVTVTHNESGTASVQFLVGSLSDLTIYGRSLNELIDIAQQLDIGIKHALAALEPEGET